MTLIILQPKQSRVGVKDRARDLKKRRSKDFKISSVCNYRGVAMHDRCCVVLPSNNQTEDQLLRVSSNKQKPVVFVMASKCFDFSCSLIGASRGCLSFYGIVCSFSFSGGECGAMRSPGYIINSEWKRGSQVVADIGLMRLFKCITRGSPPPPHTHIHCRPTRLIRPTRPSVGENLREIHLQPHTRIHFSTYSHMVIPNNILCYILG